MKPVQTRRSTVATARLAALAAIIVAVLPPLVCFGTGYLVHASTAQSIAESTAWWMSEHIGADLDRLPRDAALVRSNLPPDAASDRVIRNSAGEVLFEAHPERPLAWPLLTRTAPLHGGERVVGAVEVRRS